MKSDKAERAERRAERLINRAQEVWDNGLANVTPLPDPDEFGMVKIRYQELRRLIDERQKLSWANGVFWGIGALS
jgi:hypothetical protein